MKKIKKICNKFSTEVYLELEDKLFGRMKASKEFQKI